jgi:hypothetical protein
MIDKVFADKKINFYCAKPTFAKLLTDKYDLVVNIDSDHIVLDRLDAILAGDYDIAGPWNKNDYENASFENITEEMYVQGGLIASTNKKFWDVWEEANKDAMKYLRKENDIMNLVIYNQLSDMKLKILDKEKDYYGCKSLGREPEFTINDKGETICRGEKVYAYHFARGAVYPKLNIQTMPLRDDVKQRWNEIAVYGQSICIDHI